MDTWQEVGCRAYWSARIASLLASCAKGSKQSDRAQRLRSMPIVSRTSRRARPNRRTNEWVNQRRARRAFWPASVTTISRFCRFSVFSSIASRISAGGSVFQTVAPATIGREYLEDNGDHGRLKITVATTGTNGVSNKSWNFQDNFVRLTSLCANFHSCAQDSFYSIDSFS